MLAMKSKAKSYTRRGRAQEDDDEDDDAGVTSLPYPPSHAPPSQAAGADLDLDQELFAAGSVEVPSFQSVRASGGAQMSHAPRNLSCSMGL